MSAEVIVYTTNVCPYCVRAKALLTKKMVPFREINVERRPEIRTWLVEASKQRTVPQIFINGAPIGGFSELAALDSAGGLDPLLERAPAPDDPKIRD